MDKRIEIARAELLRINCPKQLLPARATPVASLNSFSFLGTAPAAD
jgi:hypothetical protein